jgi:hypothetical protein
MTTASCAAFRSMTAPAQQVNIYERQADGVKVKSSHDTYDLIDVPFERYGSNWSYMTYVRPHYPAGVEREIYEIIWTCYVKTIERGDYDYNVYNSSNDGDPNWSTPIDEYIDDPAFHFHGVCYQYSDYFEMLIQKEPVLKALIDKDILRSESAPSHKYWVYQEPNGIKYYIDPTWGDWTIYGIPTGQFAGWIEMSQRIEQSPTRPVLTNAIMHSWFFIQASAIGAARGPDEASERNWERSGHNLEARW